MPPTTKTLTKRLDVRVSPDTVERLREIAETEQTSIGTIARRALRIFLAAGDAERREREGART